MQLIHKLLPENRLDLMLRFAPGWDRLLQELASGRRQAKRLGAAILVRHHFQPAASLHSLNIPAEGRNVEMKNLADVTRACRTQFGGGDENVHLTHLQVEWPQGVVIDVGND